MDGNKLCYLEFFHRPLSFNFRALCFSIGKYCVEVVFFQPCELRSRFLFLKIPPPPFFMRLDNSSSKHFSQYTDLKIPKFVSLYFRNLPL